MPPSNQHRWERKRIFEYVETHPFSTIEEITKHMGWDRYFGMGMETFLVLNQLYNWRLVRKWGLYLRNPIEVKEESGDKEKRIYTIQDFIGLDSKKRAAAFMEIKKKEWQMGEVTDALHASGLRTMSETLEEESQRSEKVKKDVETIIFVYQARPGKLYELFFRLFNSIIGIDWR